MVARCVHICQAGAKARRRNSANQEIDMENAANQDPRNAPRKRWAAMDSREKTIFIAKICVMVCTGGFVFGNVVAP
jgi:phosphoribosylformylglycinamidine (FGAM) synthase-like amidotransferase family enzyme